MAHKPNRSLVRLFFSKVPDDQIQRAYRIRVALFFALVVILIAALFLSYQLTQTFRELYLVEGERDRWQRPNDVIECLKLKDGSVVADLGCGVGYFSLKLAPKVAEHGSVLAEDIFGESLRFLWIRALLRHESSIVHELKQCGLAAQQKSEPLAASCSQMIWTGYRLQSLCAVVLRKRRSDPKNTF
jgi:hypothetical protein